MKKALALCLAALVLLCVGCNNTAKTTAGGTATLSVVTKEDARQILAPVTLELQAGDTPYSLLLRAAEENKLEITNEGTDSTPYVTKIGDVAADKDGGWVFEINGEMVMKAATEVTVQPNDAVEWKYIASF